jgi:hypothetical protein
VGLILLIAYGASVAAVTLFLVNREQQRENREMRHELTQAERRALLAESELGSMAAGSVLAGRPYGMLPYRTDLHAAHARIEVLERTNERLTAWRRGMIEKVREAPLALPPPPRIRPFPQPPPEELE